MSLLDFSESNPTRVDLLSLLSAGPGGIDPLSGDAKQHYSPDPRGLATAREALAEFYTSREEGRSSGSAEISRFFLCASTSEAYGWLFKLLCDPGDAVLVPRPGYPLFDYLASLEAVEARAYRLEYRHPRGWKVDLDSLEAGFKAGRARAVVVINPNNPTGSYIHDEERKALLALCSRYGAAVIADEVFFGYPVEATTRSSFLGEEGCLVFVLDGLSKLMGLPQAKLGWIACSGPSRELAEAMGRLEVIADSYLSAGTPIMSALPDLLRRAGQFGGAARARIAENMAALRTSLEGPDSPHRVLRCGGGWTALIESPRVAPEEELAAGLLKDAGLWSQPGYFFDMEREAFFTASLILPPERLAEGARRYSEFFRRLLA
jgi:alanine-synthesizing transaminase